MTNTLLIFLGGLIISAIYGLSWKTRKKEGGDIYGYHNVGDYTAPFATMVGAIMMLAAVLIWIFDPNPP
jgi:hypothetical protein